MSGADLDQVYREAAMRAYRRERDRIEQTDLEEAVTNVRFGVDTGQRLEDDRTRWATAVHESGHAIMQALEFSADSISQITILPRGKAVGFMEQTASEDANVDAPTVGAHIRVALGGRVAEELLLGTDRVTAGCRDDLHKVSQLAMQAVGDWQLDAGESTHLVASGISEFVGRPIPDTQWFDWRIEEADAWVATQLARARDRIRQNRESLEKLAQLLCEEETLYADRIADVLGELVHQ